MDDGDLTAEAGEDQGGVRSGVAPADDHDGLLPVDRTVASGTMRHALMGELALARDAQLSGPAPCRHDDRISVELTAAVEVYRKAGSCRS
jgi:hypothetical protein